MFLPTFCESFCFVQIFSTCVRILVTELLFTEIIHLPDRCDVSRCAGTGVLCAVRVKGHTLCCVFKHFRVAFYCDGPKQVKGKFIRHFTKLDGKPHLRESMKMVYFVVLPWRCKSTLMLLKVLIAKCSKYEQESCRFKGAVWSSIQFNSNWESSYLQYQWGNNTKCLCKWRNKLFSEDNKKEGGRVRHAQTKYNSIDCVVL